MTKLRSAATFHDGLWTAIAIIGRDDIPRVAGKSYQFIRQCADEDDDGHNLTLRDAVKLDAACLLAGEGAPIHGGYGAQLRRVGAGCVLDGDPMDALVRVMAEVGDIAGVLRDALSDRSAGGRDITIEELRALLREVGHARSALDRLEDVALLVSGLVSREGGAS